MEILTSMANLGTVLIAIVATCISIKALTSQRRHMRAIEQHAKHSVRPALSIWADYPERHNSYTCRLIIGNKGFGPAILENMHMHSPEMETHWNNLDGIQKTIESSFGKRTMIDKILPLPAGYILGPGEERLIAEIKPVEYDYESTKNSLDIISTHILYRDVTGSYWKFSQHGTLSTTEESTPP